MTMSVTLAIAARRSVRAFAPGAVSREQIAQLLAAAQAAPSSLNSQPWRFLPVTDPDDIAWLASSEATRKQSWIAQAGAVIICCADIENYVKDSQSAAFFYRDNDLIQGETMDGIDAYVQRESDAAETAKFGACAMNVGIAVGFMMLRAMELDLGSCWVGMFDEPNIKARFNIPAGCRIVNLLVLGTPAEGTAPERKRKSLEEITLKGKGYE